MDDKPKLEIVDIVTYLVGTTKASDTRGNTGNNVEVFAEYPPQPWKRSTCYRADGSMAFL